jgi:cytochrome c oxidase subunit 2
MGDVARGMDLANKQGCLGCHTVDGTTLLGPTWKGLFGKDDELEDGSTVTVDEAYIAESIKDPGAKLAKGFSNIMPAFGQLAQEDIDAIIAYIRSLK